MTKRILLDTDIGSDIDDALALLLLLHMQDVELLGVTTVYGNVELRAKIAKRILQAAGVNVPVVVGEPNPLASPEPIWHAGVEGVGLLSAAEIDAPISEFDVQYDAPAFIARQAMSSPEKITIVAIGALTNIAEALEREPGLSGTVDRLVLMGAGVTFREPVPTSPLARYCVSGHPIA